MPDAHPTPEKRRITLDPDGIAAPARAPFVELGLVSCFTFLRGASDAVDLVMTARQLGYDALGIADANSMAGVVRVHSEAKTLKLRPVIGTRIETVEGLTFLAYPKNRAAYGCLCRLISAGRMTKLDGEWQDKGACEISLAMLAEHSAEVQLILLPPPDLARVFTVTLPSNVVPFPLDRRTQSHRATEEKIRSAEGNQSSIAQRPQSARSKGKGANTSAHSAVSARNKGCACGARGPSLCLCAGSARLGTGSVSENPFSLREITKPFPELLRHLRDALPGLNHLAASYLYRGDDIARIERLDMLARANGMALLATNDVHYHAPERRLPRTRFGGQLD